MSFTADIKSELTRMPYGDMSCVRAECYGMMLYASQFTMEKIRLYSDNLQVRKRIFALLKRLNSQLYMVDDGAGAIVITQRALIEKIYDTFGYEYKSGPLHLNRAVIEDDCQRAAFLRGVFLVAGYMSEPDKSYHLEFSTTHYNISHEVLLLLSEMELSGNIINRRGNYVVYYKDSEKVESFLASIGASVCAVELMLKKVEKNLRNNVNRKVNCETSNITKTIDAAGVQIEAIEKLIEAGVFEDMSEALRDTAKLRLLNPDIPLSELAAMHTPPISKPGMSARLRKIVKLGSQLKREDSENSNE